MSKAKTARRKRTPEHAGTTLDATLKIPVYLDKDDKPTCALDFSARKVCIFYCTQRFGTHETCYFSGEGYGALQASLQRRNDGQGTLIPSDTCPLWPKKSK